MTRQVLHTFLIERIENNIFQHDDKFYTEQGFFTGMVETKNLIDLNMGYRFSSNMRFDISAQNLTDDPYSAFPNMPEIRRRVIGKLTFNF